MTNHPQKYVQIHSDSYSWFKPIIFDRHLAMLERGVDSYVAWGRGRKASASRGGTGQPRELKISNDLALYRDALRSRMDDRDGFHSKRETRRLLAWLDGINPDVVHLHQLHGYYINIEMLFEWLAKSECRVLWTLHDCWAFTGHCSYFAYAKCEQWKAHCALSEKCPQLRSYPKTYFIDSCYRNFEDKKRLFNLISPEKMTLITPSQWLAELVKESFLSRYPVEVRRNDIDHSVFKPTPSDFRERYRIGNRFMILGVASPWTERKGLGDFVRLAKELDSERFAIVLVGLNKKQVKRLSHELAALPRTKNVRQLLEASAAMDSFTCPNNEDALRAIAAIAELGSEHSIASNVSTYAESDDLNRVAEAAPDLSDLKTTLIRLTGGGTVLLIERTGNQSQLAAIYTASDLFFNPTMEDNFPSVNLEARSCGARVITYDTGGCRETISDNDILIYEQSYSLASSTIRSIAQGELNA